MRFLIITAVALLSFLLTSLFSHPISYAAGIEPITAPKKPWTITFSHDVSDETANLELITIQSKNNKLSLSLSADLNKVIVKPKNPYLFGERYTLTIPGSFRAASGKLLNKPVTKEFEMTGVYITDVSATMNQLATTVSVKVKPDVVSVFYSINSGNQIKLHRDGADSFSKGQIGLVTGDLLTINVWNEANQLIETQYYEVK
ncbi:hypothetical protein SporoP37_12545 [Sporosarcina sp. P37]|uniref:Ig-like domain-containing protein n=1 Tax=unclassified Sporosarcina TaxID=2647733 RepID=UPI000A17B9F4|nr:MULTISPECIES: Ig-like domain-containing protein [unclassified Sporosarcina]ARK25403.1 hypothetical protein SporoP37_12545 [Sporosarcina sp. P37]PID19044.1 hypothetical protein CSV62_05425 [Sporosarcina sp. P35]